MIQKKPNTTTNAHLFHHLSQVQFITYSQFESPFHNLNITIYTKDLSQLGEYNSSNNFTQLYQNQLIQIIGIKK